jgi:acetyltransferase-like isoleucine patch superfamily enzyme
LLELVVSRLKLWRCIRVGRRVRVYGQVWVHGGGIVELGDGVVLDARAAPIELRAAGSAQLTIGPLCTIMGGASLESEGSVCLGARVHVGPFVKVLDNHFHALTGDRTARPPPRMVVIEDGVVLGERVIVLPGAYLEAGAQVADRAVVGRRVPAGMRARGNPAKAEPRAT